MATLTTAGAVAGTIRLGTVAGQSGTVAVGTGGGLTATTEELGYAGSGTVAQSDGTNAVGRLYVGYLSGTTGSYQLSGGSLSGQYVYVGYSGTGTFTQTGGTETANTSVGNGTYLFQGGTLSAPTLAVQAGTGVFNQSGGTLAVSTLSESAGTVTVPALTVGTGQNAATVQLTGGTFTCPTVTVQAGGSLTLGSGSKLSCSTVNVVGGTVSVPAVVLDGGTPAIAVQTPTGVARPTFNLSGGAVTASTAYLGYTAGTFAYTPPVGGTGVAASALDVGYVAGSTATFQLSAGSLGGAETVGVSGRGSFVQSGPSTNAASSLTLGANDLSSGSYTLNGGTLNVSNGTEAVGSTAVTQGNATHGYGAFYQNGGTNLVGTLTIGNGGYYLGGGTLQAGAVSLAFATSTLRVTGGAFTFGQFTQGNGNITAGAAGSPLPDPLVLGSGGVGNTYTLQNGTLTCSTITVNPGGTFAPGAGATLYCKAINLAGGQVNALSTSLDTGSPVCTFPVPSGQPQPVLNYTSGTLSGGTVTLGGSAGTFAYTQSFSLGGVLQIAPASGAEATYTLPAGQILSAGVTVGGGGVGHFVQTGGTQAGGLSVTNGTAQISGGTAGGPVFVGYGSLTQTGGTVNVPYTDNLDVGVGGYGPATYTLAGGAITGSGNEVVGGGTNFLSTGTFVQTGGSNTGYGLVIGQNGQPAGTYNLAGGTLSVYNVQISSGSFLVDGGSANLSGVSVGNFCKLVLAAGTAAAPAGTLATYSFGQSSLGELDVTLGGVVAGQQFAALSVGSATLGGTLSVTLADGFALQPGQTFDLIHGNAVTGTFSHVYLPAGLTVTYGAGDVYLTSTVPEPATSALAALGAWSLLGRRRRLGRS